MRRVLLWSVPAVALFAAACGAQADPDDAAGTVGSTATGDVDLSGVCPDPIVIQDGYLPSVVSGGMYQLVGSGGTVDAQTGSYRGPLGSTGVELEIRSGGPLVGFQQAGALMYLDEDITLGFVETDTAIELSKELPTTAVMLMHERSYRALMWDLEQHDFDDITDIAESDATILTIDGENYVEYLIHNGLVPAEKFDFSYDGSPTRFVTQPGIVQTASATHQVYQYEHDIEEWGRPVDYMLFSDFGFDQQFALVVRRDRVEELSACLERLVPLLQQASVDYLDDPAEVNAELIRVADELNTFWRLSEGLNAYGVQAMRDLGIASNGGDDTFGNFDLQQLQQFIDEVTPLFSGQETFDPGVTAEDLATNEFVDPTIGLDGSS